MEQLKKFKNLEEIILRLQQESTYGPISIGKIFDIISGKGRVLILVLLSIPFCQPIQIPGLSTPFGLVAAFIGVRVAFGKNIWLPRRILSKTISAKVLFRITNKALLILGKIKRWIHPRLYWACHSSTMRISNGLVIFVLGIFLALPMPIPFSNLTAAWSIFLIGLGLLEDDGLFVIIGYLVSLIIVAFFAIFFKLISSYL